MIFTNSDGGARGNPGPGAIGVLVREEGEILAKYSQFIGNFVTNNIAEYEALIKVLELASRFTKKQITCVMDSELVVKQLLGKYRIRDRKLLPLFLKVQKLQEKFEKIRYVHAPRDDPFQETADELVNIELERRGFKKYQRK